MRILLIGAGGQLATDLARALAGHDVVALKHDQLEVCDAAQVEEAFVSTRPHLALNTAAFHLVDDMRPWQDALNVYLREVGAAGESRGAAAT